MTTSENMQALCLAGRLILESGGETYRAEDTVCRMAHALGLKEADVFAIPSGLFISFTDENGRQCASLKRVHLRGTNLSRVDRVNRISRALTEGRIRPEELMDALEEVSRLGDSLPWWHLPLFAFITGAGFAVMFGGSWLDMAVGGLCAALTQLVPLLLPRDEPTADMAGVLLSAVVCALVPLLFTRLTGLGRPEAMIAGAVMPLVPGLSMTNAVQDVMRGDMVSGVANGVRALMIAALVAGGALAGTYLSGMGEMAAQPAAIDGLPFALRVIVLALSALVAGGAFGVLQFAPSRAVLYGGLLGMLGFLVYWLGCEFGAAEMPSMFFGMLLAAFGAHVLARRLKMVFTVFVTISMMPLVPGLGLYRAMRAFAEGRLGDGAALAATAMRLILMIALGIAMASTLWPAVAKLLAKGRKRT